jgi:co-chaperonin GroES (HSP10)
MTEIINGTLRPLRDKIIVKPLDWEPSKIISVVRKGRPLRGTVIAAGPGTYVKRYKKDANGQRKSFTLAPHFQRTEVKPGDVVELGGLNQFDGLGYQFTEVTLNGELALICSEKDVCLIVESEAA